PIAPHNLNVRPLVVPMSSCVEMRFGSRSGSALLAVDNRPFDVASGTEITISRGSYGLRYVSFSDNNFIGALRTKLLWGEDRRNTI
ncbi:MAG: NAD(+) kinase, partial [Bacteroidales bacterium]|nr:NAD(+) kinase [Bacteroidales bacterium]